VPTAKSTRFTLLVFDKTTALADEAVVAVVAELALLAKLTD
jgi:hypothetical protein